MTSQIFICFIRNSVPSRLERSSRYVLM
jgi:hypothetical protein